jgi:hypothetical protein
MEGQKESKDSIWASNKSPLNTSKAKAMFTFPKQERFPTLHTEGRYPSHHSAINFTKKNPCSISDRPPSATAIRSKSERKENAMQEQSFTVARQILPSFGVRERTKARIDYRSQQGKLQLHFHLQSFE